MAENIQWSLADEFKQSTKKITEAIVTEQVSSQVQFFVHCDWTTRDDANVKHARFLPMEIFITVVTGAIIHPSTQDFIKLQPTINGRT